MADEYIPTTEEVREQFAANIARFGPGFGTSEFGREDFDRWLAQHDREMAAKAWDEGHGTTCDGVRSSLDGCERHNPHR